MEEEVIELRPDLKQLCNDCMGMFVVIGIIVMACLLLSGQIGLLMYQVSLLIIAALLCIIIAKYLDLRNTRWIITDETICKESGIVSRRKDYIELYRVVDYKETQTLLQRMLDIKTVSIVSTDKLDPLKDICGVPASLDIVKPLREKVECCKRKKRIYEITNN